MIQAQATITKDTNNIHNLPVKHISKKLFKILNQCPSCNSKNINFYIGNDGFQELQCLDCDDGSFFQCWYDNFPLNLNLNGFMDDGSFDSNMIEAICPYCKTLGKLRKKQTRINGWTQCCKDCFEFFGDPIFRNYNQKNPSYLERDSNRMIHYIIQGHNYKFKDCCIDYFLAFSQPNGIASKIPEYDYKLVQETDCIQCPQCMIKEIGMRGRR